jgi:DUF177 domain-containing protein
MSAGPVRGHGSARSRRYSGGMTSFNLRALRLRSGEQYRDEVDVDVAPLEFGGERYVPVPETIPAELTVSRASTGTVFELRFRGRLHGPCQRCLGDAVMDREVSAREYQASSRDAADELRSPYIHEDRLDVSAWARDALALDLPEQIHCRPDCAGLCPVCGQDLNTEPHEHEEEQADPRWAALAELREKL